jgi:CHAT domain-containing protein
LALLLVQYSPSRRSKPKIQADNEEAPELRSLRHLGNKLFRAGDYLRAIGLYQTGYEQANHRGNLRSAVRFLNNLGGGYYKVFQYRHAIQAYLKARDLALLQDDRETLGAIWFNLSSLYFDIGDSEAALECAEQGLQLPSEATAKFKARLLIQCARIKGPQDSDQAVALLEDAIEASRSELDMASEAQAWNELGNAQLDSGRLQLAERALLVAFRLRFLNHDDRLYFSYESLGNLRMRQGDLRSALSFFERAVDAARVVGPSAMWSAYYERGTVKLELGRLRESFDDFKAALECARRWRAEVLPADAFRIDTEVQLNQIYSSFIEVGSRLHALTGERRFVAQTFAAAEESRAASLRALWAGPDLTKRLPNEYWEALAELYRTEGALADGDPDVNTRGLRQLRLKLAEMEALAGLDFPYNLANTDPIGGGLLERTQRALRSTEVFLAFHLGEMESCLWVITHRGFEFHQLARRARLSENVDLFVKALRENSPEAVALGNRLYKQLFGACSRRLLNKPVWILALDGPLFEVPFAALVEGSKLHSAAPVYVVERHAIQIVPGISALFNTTLSEVNGPVVGLGDPIYNRADPRFTRRASSAGWSEREQPGPQSPVFRLELARLVGSAREIENCARIWRLHGYEPTVLTGADANREKLAEALQHQPFILHVAAHVLFPPQDSGRGVIALALQSGGKIELLSASEIASMRLTLGLVVLNGCSSARAATLPGAGLMGMTRAWLAAGARAVIVTRWATTDQDAGQLFESFYERLPPVQRSPRLRSFAQMLQQAQFTELRAGGRRANPARWAAYFCVERN